MHSIVNAVDFSLTNSVRGAEIGTTKAARRRAETIGGGQRVFDLLNSRRTIGIKRHFIARSRQTGFDKGDMRCGIGIADKSEATIAII